MGLIKNGLVVLKDLENYQEWRSKENIRNMRLCAVLSLVSTLILNAIPLICGFLLDWVTQVIKEGGTVDIGIVLDACTLIFMMVVMWYVMSSHYSRIMTMMSLETSRDIRSGLNRKMMKVSIPHIDNMPAGDYSTRFTVDLPAVFKLTSKDYTGFIAHLVMLIGIIVMMFISSPILALVYVLIMPISIYISARLTKQSEADFVSQKLMVSRLNSQMSDIITTHSTIKSENMEDEVLTDFKSFNNEYKEAFIKSNTRAGMISPVVDIMVNIGYLMTVIVGAILILNDMLQIGMFLTFMIYVRLLNNPLNMTVTKYNELRDEVISLHRIVDILKMEEEQDEAEGSTVGIGDGTIRFEDVGFSYVKGVETLHGLSFTIEPNVITVLTGPTGCGKTTVANLIMKFYSPDKGRITIGGADLNTISDDTLSRNVAMILQEPWVFDGTIRENIIYNSDVSEDDLMKVCHLTGLDSYVSLLPNGYDTVIGQNINSMPLAQRRMIAIARALIRDPKILIMDEAVAGLDPITGFTIFQKLDEMKEGRTIVIISHNKALIDSVDRVIDLPSKMT